MSANRHRRGTTALRAAALLGFVAAAALVVVAVAVDSRAGLRMGAAVGAVLVGFLAGLLLRTERGVPLAVGAARARQAAGFTAVQDRLVADQRAVVDQLARRLVAADQRGEALAATVADLEQRLAEQRVVVEPRAAAQTAAEPDPTLDMLRELVTLSDASMADLWPDLTEAPTVVDLLSRDERATVAASGTEPASDPAPEVGSGGGQRIA